MTYKQAQQIGRRETLLVASAGLLSAYMLWSIPAGFLWIFGMTDGTYIYIGILLIFVFAYFFGGMTGVKILLKKRDHTWWGFLCGVSVVFCGTALASLINFFGHYNSENGDLMYLLGPVYSVFLLPMVPLPVGLFGILFFGFWLGRRIKKKEVIDETA